MALGGEGAVRYSGVARVELPLPAVQTQVPTAPTLTLPAAETQVPTAPTLTLPAAETRAPSAPTLPQDGYASNPGAAPDTEESAAAAVDPGRVKTHPAERSLE
jgi:hypothetical protein